MLIRQLEYFVAVARERHFGRAATACFVAQPTLSDALRKLESELDVPLIRRTRTFEGLTPEGERLVVWARRVLADHDAMVDEARSMRTGLTGRLRIGSVPTASTTVAQLVTAFSGHCPLATVELSTKLASEEIVRRLRTFELDAALSVPLDGVHDVVGVEVYREGLVLVGTPELVGVEADVIDWATAATFRLAALTASMFDRTAVDAAFSSARVTPDIAVESDSIAALYSLVRDGFYAAIVPDCWALDVPPSAGLRTLRLVGPAVTRPIQLVRLHADPVRPLLRALESSATRWSRRLAEDPAAAHR